MALTADCEREEGHVPTKDWDGRAGADRKDPVTGDRELAGYIGTGSERVVGFTHLPAGQLRGGLVICSSLFNEFTKNYRREVTLARSLARMGIAVQRFHYRGTGHSDDPAGGVTFQTLVDDTVAAVDHLTSVTDLDQVAFMGTRFGALAAVSAASACGGDSLLLLEPVTEAGRFFREGFRAKMMEGARSKSAPSSAAAMVDTMRAEGSLDVLGEPMGWPLYESAVERTAVAELDAKPKTILLVQIGADLALRPEYASAVDEWSAQGHSVAVERVGRREAWWFIDPERDYAGGEVRPLDWNDGDPVLGVLMAWVTDHVPAAVAS
jgi:pimeloyl-ACP methyl ester carboxylesterase